MATFWPDIDLDLNKAVLHALDMWRTVVRRATFGGARFVGWVRFDGAQFLGDAIFGGATFEKSASFRSTRFGADVRIRGAKFRGAATFEGEPSFGGVRGPAENLMARSSPKGRPSPGRVRPPVLDHVRVEAPLLGLPGWGETAAGQARCSDVHRQTRLPSGSASTQ